MNAMQMAAAVAMKSLMANLPPEVVETIGQIGSTVAAFKAQLDRIESNQRVIMFHLNIASEDHNERAGNGLTIVERASDGSAAPQSRE